jgi:hypothetical protein
VIGLSVITSQPENSGESKAALGPATREALPLLIALIGGVICYSALVNRGMGLPILGYNISPAERVMHGELPYRDFIYNYTPGVLWLNAALMKLFGACVMTVNFGLLVFKLAALLALFYAARQLTSARAALIPVALALGWIGYKVVFRAYPTQYSMLFVLLGLIFMLKYDRSGKLRWLVLCGVVIGAVFLFKQNVGVFVLAAATGSIILRESIASEGVRLSSRMLSATREALVCWAGFAAIVAPALAYLAYEGVLGAMIGHFVSLAGQYGDKKAIALPQARLVAPVVVGLIAVAAIGAIVVRFAPRFFETFIVLVLVCGTAVLLIPGRARVVKTAATAAVAYMPLTLFVVAVLFAAWQFRKRGRGDWWSSAGPVLIVSLFALGAYLEMYPRADYAHLVRALPPVFLLLFLLVARAVPELTTRFQNRLSHPRRAAMLCGAVPLVLLFSTGIKDAWQPRFDSSFRFVEQTPLEIERARGILVSRKQAAFIEELAATIEAHSSPDDPIFSFAPRGTAFYFLSARRNPTQFVWWRSVGIKGRDREALINSLAGRVPKLVIISQSFHNERLLAEINANYHLAGEAGDIRIYDRNQPADETNVR